MDESDTTCLIVLPNRLGTRLPPFFGALGTVRADLDLDLIFRDVQARLWQVVDLPSQYVLHGNVIPRMSTRTLPTDGEDDHSVWLRAHLQRFSHMTRVGPR